MSSAPGGTGAISPFSELILGLFLGALAGLILGFIVSSLLRYVSLFVGRNLAGANWAIYGALAGAIVMAMVSLVQED